MSYKKFAGMLAASFVIMYGVMFLNTDQLEHIYLSNTRLYMTLLMVAPMALLKLLFMGTLYKNKKLNIGIAVISILVFMGAYGLLRSQTFVGDRQYIKAMIPHHSSAIMTSQSAHLQHPEVQQLAKDIIEAQKKEIATMKRLLKELN